MAAAGATHVGDVEEDASQLMFPKGEINTKQKHHTISSSSWATNASQSVFSQVTVCIMFRVLR